ncbi:hypothetical protein LXL81_05160 [Dyadobacter sp. CY356]|nr:hypothetical protein [Dyadobacter sp. CY356]
MKHAIFIVFQQGLTQGLAKHQNNHQVFLMAMIVYHQVTKHKPLPMKLTGFWAFYDADFDPMIIFTKVKIACLSENR